MRAMWRRWLGRYGIAGSSALRELTQPPDGLAAFLFDQTGDGLLLLDRDARILHANAAMRALAGTADDLGRGASALALFTGAQRERVAAAVAAALAGPAAAPAFPTTLRAEPSDVDIAVLASVAAIRARDGAPFGALLRLTDVSALRALEAQLAQAQRLQALGHFAGGIAHDFNNLLAVVQGATENAASHANLPAEVADDLGHIRASATRGAALIRQLLAFDEPPAPQADVLDLNDVVRDLSGLLRRLLGSRVRLDLSLQPSSLMVRADPTQLDQVLVNLAVNARDAMPNGGTLTMRTGHVTLRRPRARGADVIAPGPYLRVDVMDTGIGMRPDIAARVFEPYFTTRRAQGGTGLGLSTVHSIVRQCGGFLEVESAVGAGSTIRVFLPHWDDKPDAGPAASVAASARMPAPTAGAILLVDDEDPVRHLAERALSRAGWPVIAAADGPAALAALDGHTGAPVVAIVTDMVMPGMDGVAVVREVRRRLQAPRLPALLVSGYADASLQRVLAAESQVSFLTKPYAMADLIESLVANITAAKREMDQAARTDS